MSIKPFNKVRLPAAADGAIVRVKYLRKALQMVLGRLNITAKGAQLQQTGDGHLHIEISGLGGGDSTAPFAVSTVDSGVIIAGGTLRLSGSVVPSIRVGATPIVKPANANNWTPPVLAVPIGRSYIVLHFSYNPIWGSIPVAGVAVSFIRGASIPGGNVTVRALSPTAAVDVPSEIDYPAGEATTGEAFIRLAIVDRTADAITVISQDWRSNIAAACQGDGLLFLAAA